MEPKTSSTLKCQRSRVLLLFIAVVVCQSLVGKFATISRLSSKLLPGKIDDAPTTKNAISSSSFAYNNWTRHAHNKRQSEIARSKEIIPTWMAEYLIWHKQQRDSLANHTANNATIKYLVVRCLGHEECGGFSDRMKPMPFYVMLANLTQRVLLIHWQKPCELEQFLVPPLHGLDWRIAGTPVTITDVHEAPLHQGHGNGMSLWMQQMMGVKEGGETYVQAQVVNINLDGGQFKHNAWVIFNKWRREPGQILSHSSAYYGWNPNAKNVSEHDLFEDVFRIMFEPSPSLQEELYHKMKHLDILDKEYNVAQIRAKDPRLISDEIALEWANKSDPANIHNPYTAKRHMDLMETVEVGEKLKSLYVKVYSNAIECANNLTPGLPIYIASDTDFGEQMQTISNYSLRVAAAENSTGPLHIDNGRLVGRNPKDFYLLFLDLYIMERAKCLSYGSSFGMFPLHMRWNACSLDNRKNDCIASNVTEG